MSEKDETVFKYGAFEFSEAELVEGLLMAAGPEVPLSWEPHFPVPLAPGPVASMKRIIVGDQPLRVYVMADGSEMAFSLDVAAVLGFDPPSALATEAETTLAAEFERGWTMWVDGPELEQLKRQLGPHGYMPSESRRALMFRNHGINAALIGARTPVSHGILKWLNSKVPADVMWGKIDEIAFGGAK